jgi:hypothetical protein
MENVTEMSDHAEQYYIITKRWLADLDRNPIGLFNTK